MHIFHEVSDLYKEENLYSFYMSLAGQGAEGDEGFEEGSGFGEGGAAGGVEEGALGVGDAGGVADGETVVARGDGLRRCSMGAAAGAAVGMTHGAGVGHMVGDELAVSVAKTRMAVVGLRAGSATAVGQGDEGMRAVAPGDDALLVAGDVVRHYATERSKQQRNLLQAAEQQHGSLQRGIAESQQAAERLLLLLG